MRPSVGWAKLTGTAFLRFDREGRRSAATGDDVYLSALRRKARLCICADIRSWRVPRGTDRESKDTFAWSDGVLRQTPRYGDCGPGFGQFRGTHAGSAATFDRCVPRRRTILWEAPNRPHPGYSCS